MALAEAEAIVHAEVGSNGKTSKDVKRRVNRSALPEHLPRLEMIVDVEDKICRSCVGALHPIGEGEAENANDPVNRLPAERERLDVVRDCHEYRALACIVEER